MKDIFIVPGLGQEYVELEDMILLSEEYVKTWIAETKASPGLIWAKGVK